MADEHTGMGTAEAALLILSIFIVVAVIGGIVLPFLTPKEQAIIDTTTSVWESKEYSERLEAGQVIHVSVDVISNGPIVVSIWNDDTWDTLWESDFIYDASLDLTVTSSGVYIFEIVNFGDGSARVRIKVTIKSSPEPGAVTPATFEVSNLVFVPSEVEVGQAVEISVTVTNAGDLQGTHTVMLKIDGQIEASDEVALAGGASQTVSFTVTEDIAGTYAIEVNGLTKNLEVLEPPEVSNLPFEISNLTFPSTVGVGSMVKIEVMLSNPRDTRNTYSVALRIDNGIKATKEVTLAAWTEQTVSFTVTEDVVGTHTISVDGLHGTLKVLEATVGLWHLDGNANDETSNVYHGTVHGAVMTPGKFGGAYGFDGIDDYIAIPTLFPVSPSEVTVECWVKTDYMGPGPKFIFFHLGGVLYLDLCESKFRGTVSLANVTHYRVSTTWTPIVGDWYYLALVWKRNEKVKLFVNGELEAETAVPDYALLDHSSRSNPAGIGCHTHNKSWFWDGAIDEVRVSRVARTADEIRSHFESGLPHHG